MKRTYLVTGAAGFIGFHTVRRLLAGGHRVVGIDNLNDYYDPKLKTDRLALLEGREGFHFHRLDLCDRAGMEALFADAASEGGFGTVVHLAAQAGVRHSLTNPHSYVESNVTGFMHLLEGCRHHEVGHLLYASTSSVYGLNRSTPFSEAQTTDHPLTIYSATKKACEAMAHAYAHLFQLPCTGVRFFTVYGPWGRPDMAYYMFARRILAGEPIPVYGEGAPSRDFTYIDDIVDGIMEAARLPPPANPSWDARNPDPGTSAAPWRILNIGATRKVNLMAFIRALEEALGVDARMEMLPMQPGDVLETHADTGRLAELTGYAPKVPVEEGVKRFVDWYLSYHQPAQAGGLHRGAPSARAPVQP
ncbi:MAG: NAD-dependent epimerase [Gemmatimonadales bacterium]|nr:MAG: NAD-dependent epimerase [Gemmatimonadales bacterium]